MEKFAKAIDEKLILIRGHKLENHISLDKKVSEVLTITTLYLPLALQYQQGELTQSRLFGTCLTDKAN